MFIFGVGETARLANYYFENETSEKVSGFIADDEFLERKQWMNDSHRLIRRSEIESKIDLGEKIFCAIGSGKLNRERRDVYNFLKEKGYCLASFVSPYAYIAKDVTIGDNAFILENNVIQSGARIGCNVTLWSGNHIGHGTEVQENCFISSHVVIAGFAVIKKYTFIGINSTVGDHVVIENSNFIGAGCTISKSTEKNQVFKANSAVASKVDSLRFCKVQRK